MAKVEFNSDSMEKRMSDFDWRQFLICPVCCQDLSRDGHKYVCTSCNKTYPSIGEKPILLPDVDLDENELEAFSKRLAMMETKDYRHKTHTKNSGLSDFRSYFFDEIFPKLNARDPQWNFLANKVFQMRNDIAPGSIVLDIGAGECKYAPILPHCRYLAFDFAQLSSSYDFSGLDFIGDATKIPLADGSADVALNFSVLEHVPSIGDAIAEMARVLKPGGVCYCFIPLVRPEHMVPFDFHRLTRYGIEKNFADHELEIEELQESNGAFWTAAFYLRQIAATHPLISYGRRSIRGIIESVFWRILFGPLIWFGRLSDSRYNKSFPIYFFVKARKPKK